ncbi:MAG TPA: hypothetical protein DIV86_05760 [Alphaproteobacteria bacterium]|nr:hypothetical protein [Alphaproteobacteria bacterium]
MNLEQAYIYIIAGIFILFVIILCYIYVHLISALFIWPPTIPTDKRTANKMLEAAKKYFNQQQVFEVAELGVGYGGLTKRFSRYFEAAKFTGIELLFVPYLFSKIYHRKNPKVRLIHNSFLNESLSGFDLFLTFYIRGDKKLPEKLMKEAKKGAIVISNNFEIIGLELLEKLEVKYLVDKHYVYVHRV